MAEAGAGVGKVPKAKWATHDANIAKVCSVCANLEGKAKGDKLKPSQAQAAVIVDKFNPSYTKGSRFCPQGLCTTCHAELWRILKGQKSQTLHTPKDYHCVPSEDTGSPCTCWCCEVGRLHGNAFNLWKLKERNKKTALTEGAEGAGGDGPHTNLDEDEEAGAGLPDFPTCLRPRESAQGDQVAIKEEADNPDEGIAKEQDKLEDNTEERTANEEAGDRDRTTDEDEEEEESEDEDESEDEEEEEDSEERAHSVRMINDMLARHESRNGKVCGTS